MFIERTSNSHRIKHRRYERVSSAYSSAALAAVWANGFQHHRCSNAGAHLIERVETLYMLRHLFNFRAILNAMRENDGRSCTISQALTICGDDMDAARFIQTLHCLGRKTGRRTFNGRFFDVNDDLITRTKEFDEAFLTTDVAVLRVAKLLKNQFPDIDDSALWQFINNHELACNRFAIRLRLSTWRQFAVIFYLSWRHQSGDSFVAVSDVARYLHVESKRVMTAVQQMHYEVARMIVVSSNVEDSRAKEMALSPKLKQQLNVFHDQFAGFFPSEIQDATLELRKL